MNNYKLTLWGIESYMKMQNKTLFQNTIVLPEHIDKPTLINTIMLQGGEFEVLYSDPDFLVEAINSWFNKWKDVFQKWDDALQEDFNPLHNYDRHEEYTDTINGTVGHTGTSSATGHNSASTSDEDKRTAVNSPTSYWNYDQTTNTGTSDATSSGTDSYTDTTANTVVHSAHLYGNIGVTQSTEMLRNYIETEGELNLYNIISDMFVKDFCLMVY